MGTISMTYDFVDGTTAEADEVDANFATIVNEFNGSIDNDNIKAAAGILGSKLNLAIPGAIGGTTPAAGAFTTLATSGAITAATTLNVTGLSTLATATIAGVTVASGTVDKTRTIAFTAAGAIPAATNGANQAKVAGTNFEYYQLEFDKDTDESVFWIFPCPPQYDGGNVEFEVISKCASVTSGTVVWVMTTASVADSATWDAALGTTVTFDAKTVDGTALDIFTATKTADPGWVADKICILKLYRDVSEDSAAEDVDVVAVNAYWEVT